MAASAATTSVFITGSSRGIGLEMARRLAQSGSYHVFAGARHVGEGSTVQELASQFSGFVTPVEIDVTDDASIERAAALVSEKTDSLEILINNAGVLLKRGRITDADPERAPDRESIREEFEVNSISPVFVAKAFLPLLNKSQAPLKRLVNISSTLGSIARTSGGMMGYRMSKAGVNMATATMAVEVNDSQDASTPIVCLAIHPGWVQTDMGGKNADIDVATSAEGVLNVISSSTADQNGKFFDYAGREVPW